MTRMLCELAGGHVLCDLRCVIWDLGFVIVSYVTMTQLIATRNAGLTQRHNSSNNQNSASVHFDQIQYALLCPCFTLHIIVHR